MSCGIGCGSADDDGRHSGLGVTSPAARTGSTRSNARVQWQRTHVGGHVPSLGIAADSAAEHGSGRARSTMPPALRESRPTSSAEKKRPTASPTLYQELATVDLAPGRQRLRHLGLGTH